MGRMSTVCFLMLMVCQRGFGDEGPEIELTDPDPQFVLITSATIGVEFLGVIAGKNYIVASGMLIFYPDITDYEIRYNDFSDTAVIHTIKGAPLTGPGLNYAVLKICPGLTEYTAASFEGASFPDHTATNYSSDTGNTFIYYYRASTSKYFKKVVDVWDDAACNADIANNEANGDFTAGTLKGCMPFQDCPDTCVQYFDTPNLIQPWLVINGQPIGAITDGYCESSTAPSTGTTGFAKIAGQLTELIALIPEGFENVEG